MQHKATIFYTWEQGKSAYNFPFPYLSKQFVKVRVDHANASTLLEYNRDYTIEGQTLTLTNTQPFIAGATLCIHRQTPTGSLVDFSDGSLLLASEMDRLSTHLLHVEEENSDLIASTGMFADDDNAWQGQGKRIKNLSDPQQPQDVVTLNYLDGVGVARQGELQRIETAVRADKESTLSFKNEAASFAQDAATSASTSAQSAAASEASRQASAESESKIKNMQVDVHAIQQHIDEVKTAIDGVATQAKADGQTASDAAVQAQRSAGVSAQSAAASEASAVRAEAAARFDGVIKSENLAEKSVHKKHLHQDAYESPALTGTPTAPTAGKGTNNGQIASTAFVAQAIAALVNSAPGALDTLQELASALGNDANFSTTVTNALAGKVSKSGDTMTGPLNVPILDVRSGFFGDYKRDAGDAIEGNGGANVNVGSWYGIGFYDTYNKKYTGSMDLRAGYWRTLGKIRADQGFVGDLAGTADNANKLGGQSLQWIINQINAAKTGIVAGNLAQNGWVKFANGLILQWGLSQKAYDSYVAFPVSYPQQCFCVQVSSRWLNRGNPYECFSLPYDIKASGFSFRMDGGDNQVLWLAIGI